MKSYYRTKHLIIIVVFMYFIIGVTLEFSYRYMSTHSKEIFPIYSWSLFAKTPSEVNDFSIRVISYKGQKLEQPFFFEEAGDRFPEIDVGNARNPIQVLGKATLQGDNKKAAEMISLLNTLYPGLIENMDFELVRRKYDPLERLKFNKYREIKTERYFHKEGE